MTACERADVQKREACVGCESFDAFQEMTGGQWTHDLSVSTSLREGISPTGPPMIMSCVSGVVGMARLRTLDDLAE
jgi:hypothetical protein